MESMGKIKTLGFYHENLGFRFLWKKSGNKGLAFPRETIDQGWIETSYCLCVSNPYVLMLLTLISKGQLLVVTFFPVCLEHSHYMRLLFKRRVLAGKKTWFAKDQEDRSWWGFVNGRPLHWLGEVRSSNSTSWPRGVLAGLGCPG